MPAYAVSPAESVSETLDRWRAGERVEVLGSEFLEVLASAPDPRDPRGCRYPLAGLLAIAVLATAAGMRGYAGFATWAATAPPEVLALSWTLLVGQAATVRKWRAAAGDAACGGDWV